MANVTPWEIKGKVDYGKLIKEFGVKPFTDLPKGLDENLLFRRGLVYAHRDFERIAEAIEKGEPFAMMTGLMPTGKMHLGHKMVAEQIIAFQKLGAHVYVCVADLEAYATRGIDPEQMQQLAVEEYLLNYVALGLDLEKVDFYFQSKRSSDGKKANAYYRLAGELSRHATFNEFKGVYGEISPARMTASLVQASDMLHPQLPEFEGKALPTVIPVGIDQDPHIRIARDMAKRYPHYAFTPISGTYNVLMPGLKSEKMSSSDENSYIALSDSPEVAEKKVKKYAFSGGQPTLEEHREKGGDPDIDVSFQMLRYGLEEDDAVLADIAEKYRAGEILSGEMKQLACDKLTAFLKSHQEKREAARSRVAQYIKERGLE